MSLANSIGLLALLAIIALIIIYIIKPNFQQKFISSTFVWKLSLKYRKKRIPISKLRNILLVICQLLILTSCALILAKPVVEAEPVEEFTEKVFVVDASANMMAISRNPGEEKLLTSRFERAINEVKKRANEVLSTEGGRITIILAGEEAKYFTFNTGASGVITAQRITKDYGVDDGLILSSLNIALDNIITDVNIKPMFRDDNNLSKYCTYGSGDLTGAMDLAADVMNYNPYCEVLYFTGKQYVEKVENLTVVDVGTENEKNLAILNGTAVINANNAYTYTLDVTSYGFDGKAEVIFTAEGVNANPRDEENLNGTDYLGTDEADDSESMYYKLDVDLRAGETQRVTFDTWHDLITQEEIDKNQGNEEDIVPSDPRVTFSFKSVTAQIRMKDVNENQFYDALTFDNEFRFYGGETPALEILYCSNLDNPFMSSINNIWQTLNTDTWNVNVTKISYAQYEEKPEEYIADLYVFEHIAPPVIPEDGIVVLFDPVPDGDQVGFEKYGIQYLGQLGSADVDDENHIPWENAYPVAMTNTKHILSSHIGNVINSGEVKVTKYTKLGMLNEDYEKFKILANIPGNNDDPAIMVNDEDGVVIFTLDINATNFAMKPAFPEFMIDLFDHFFPKTISQFSYTVGDTATFNSFAKRMDWSSRTKDSMRGDLDALPFESFPASLKLDEWGTYTLTQELKSKVQVKMQFYVKMPSSESDIKNIAGTPLEGPRVNIVIDTPYEDLLIWFAAALVALLFVEWLLQAREYF